MAAFTLAGEHAGRQSVDGNNCLPIHRRFTVPPKRLPLPLGRLYGFTKPPSGKTKPPYGCAKPCYGPHKRLYDSNKLPYGSNKQLSINRVPSIFTASAARTGAVICSTGESVSGSTSAT